MTINDHKLQQSIIATLRYSDHFNFPLTLQELSSRLINSRVAMTSLHNSLDLLLKQKEIFNSRGYYFLPGRQALIKSRQTHQKISYVKRQLAQIYAQKLHFPGVVALYLTGSLAVNNAVDKDDIDLMVITAPGRLWTTRLLLTLYCELLGIRRRPNEKNTSNRLCLNLYLDSASLTLPESKRNLYSAYELIQAVPLYDPDNTHALLLRANSWLNSYLPNFPIPKDRPPSLVASNQLRQSGSFPLILIENLAYFLQKMYMRNKITLEYITKHSAFFHPDNPAKDIIEQCSIPSKPLQKSQASSGKVATN